MKKDNQLPKRRKAPGATQLFGSLDVQKADLRVQLLGDLDELVSALGVARSHLDEKPLDSILRSIQSILLAAGADVADPKARQEVAVSAEDAEILELATDSLRKSLPPLRNFILPGGDKSATSVHMARSVCRRAERTAVALNAVDPLSVPLLDFLNRLSTYLFHLARRQTRRRGEADDLWAQPEHLQPGELDVETP